MTELELNKAEFADALEHLLGLPLESASDVATWHEQRFQLEKSFSDRLPELLVTAEIAHFLDDADVRSRDPGYRDHQHELIRRRIAALRSKT